MAHGPRYGVHFRRRREGKTDFNMRRRMLKSRKHRAVFRKSLKNVQVQIVDYDEFGDRILISATGHDLRKYGWEGSVSNIPAAYLTGYLAGRRALEKGVEEAVFDMGLVTPSKGCRAFSALKGMIDAGLNIPHGEDVLPDEDRIKGAHINEQIIKKFEETKNKMEG